MSLRTIASEFVKLCRQGKNFDVMHTLYAPNIVSVEGDGKETVGLQLLDDLELDQDKHTQTCSDLFETMENRITLYRYEGSRLKTISTPASRREIRNAKATAKAERMEQVTSEDFLHTQEIDIAIDRISLPHSK